MVFKFEVQSKSMNRIIRININVIKIVHGKILLSMINDDTQNKILYSNINCRLIILIDTSYS